MDRDVHERVVAEAAAEGVSVSAWMTAAARRALLVRDGMVAVAEWEAEHGAISVAELDALEDKVAEARRSAKERRRRAGTEAGQAVAS